MIKKLGIELLALIVLPSIACGNKHSNMTSVPIKDWAQCCDKTESNPSLTTPLTTLWQEPDPKLLEIRVSVYCAPKLNRAIPTRFFSLKALFFSEDAKSIFKSIYRIITAEIQHFQIDCYSNPGVSILWVAIGVVHESSCNDHCQRLSVLNSLQKFA